MERRRGPMVDGVSRALSLLTIVIGGGLLLFLYQENRQLKQEVTDLRTEVPDTSQLYELAKKFDNDFENLARFESGVTKTVETAKSDLGVLREEFVQASRQLRTDRIDLAKANKSLTELQSVIYPRLQVAEKRMKVGSGDRGNFVFVNNEGLNSAEIRSVEFWPRPEGQFRTTPADNQAAIDCLTDGKTLVIQFSKNDNQSESKDKELHKNYLRTYTETNAPVIPGQQTLPVAVLLRNKGHIGWGWEGSLEISYSDGKSLSVPSVRAIFMSDETDTI